MLRLSSFRYLNLEPWFINSTCWEHTIFNSIWNGFKRRPRFLIRICCIAYLVCVCSPCSIFSSLAITIPHAMYLYLSCSPFFPPPAPLPPPFTRSDPPLLLLCVTSYTKGDVFPYRVVVVVVYGNFDRKERRKEMKMRIRVRSKQVSYGRAQE